MKSSFTFTENAKITRKFIYARWFPYASSIMEARTHFSMCLCMIHDLSQQSKTKLLLFLWILHSDPNLNNAAHQRRGHGVWTNSCGDPPHSCHFEEENNAKFLSLLSSYYEDVTVHARSDVDVLIVQIDFQSS